MPGTDIFLSYARVDRATARVIAQCLCEEGLSVWWDASLHSGETFDEVIERNLKESKAVVVLWSPASVASRWVRAEATLADRRNKLVPAIIQACDRPIIFELTHTAELTEWSGDKSDPRWRIFVDDLYRLVNSADDPRNVAGKSIGEKRDEISREPRADFSAANRAARQPLRPGNSEVIVPAKSHREAPSRSTHPSPLPPEQEVHCLQIEEGELAKETIVVGSAGGKIGRKAPADIVLAHRSISREHCIVGIANDELLVTDLNSTNGTFIDDVRISRATILPVGSILRVGEIAMRHAVLPQRGNAIGQFHNSGGRSSGQPGRFAAAS